MGPCPYSEGPRAECSVQVGSHESRAAGSLFLALPSEILYLGKKKRIILL